MVVAGSCNDDCTGDRMAVCLFEDDKVVLFTSDEVEIREEPAVQVQDRGLVIFGAHKVDLVVLVVFLDDCLAIFGQ